MRPIVPILSALVFTVLPNHAVSQSRETDWRGCSVRAQWTNAGATVDYSRTAKSSKILNLLIQIGADPNCETAELHLAVTYLDSSQDVICAGVIRSAANVQGRVQGVNLEFRPLQLIEFVRWRNPPGVRSLQPAKRLICMNPEGTAEVTEEGIQRSAFIRVSAGVYPFGGGLSVADSSFRILP